MRAYLLVFAIIGCSSHHDPAAPDARDPEDIDAPAARTCPSTGGGLCEGLVGYWNMDEANPDGSQVVTRRDQTACHNDLVDISDDVEPYAPGGVDIDYTYSKPGRPGHANAACGRQYASYRPRPPTGDSAELAVEPQGPGTALDLSGTPFTVAIWFTLQGPVPPSNGHMLYKGLPVGPDISEHELALEINGAAGSTDMHFVVFDNSGPQQDWTGLNATVRKEDFDPDLIVPGEWHLAVGEYDGSHTATLTIDDDPSKSATVTDPDFLYADMGHKIAINNGVWSNRVVDDAMIWRRLLTDEEKHRLYDGGNGPNLGCTP